MKDSKNILLFKNRWHRNIARKNIDNYLLDAIRINFNFDETYIEIISGQRYYDNDNILCKAKANDNFLTLKEMIIYRYYNFENGKWFKTIDYFIKDKIYIVYFED